MAISRYAIDPSLMMSSDRPLPPQPPLMLNQGGINLSHVVPRMSTEPQLEAARSSPKYTLSHYERPRGRLNPTNELKILEGQRYYRVCRSQSPDSG